MIKHGDLLCANLGIIFKIFKNSISNAQIPLLIFNNIFNFSFIILQEIQGPSHMSVVVLKIYLKIITLAIPRKGKGFIPWVVQSKITGKISKIDSFWHFDPTETQAQIKTRAKYNCSSFKSYFEQFQNMYTPTNSGINVIYMF